MEGKNEFYPEEPLEQLVKDIEKENEKLRRTRLIEQYAGQIATGLWSAANLFTAQSAVMYATDLADAVIEATKE